MSVTAWSRGLEVSGDGAGLVSHAGIGLLRRLADKTGLTRGLSAALASGRLVHHDRGRVAASLGIPGSVRCLPRDLACVIARAGGCGTICFRTADYSRATVASGGSSARCGCSNLGCAGRSWLPSVMSITTYTRK